MSLRQILRSAASTATTLSTRVLLATASASLLSANMAQAAEPKRGGTAVFAIGAEPSSINRDVSSSTPEGLVACTVYEGLVSLQPSGKFMPLLAKHWSVSPDGKSYTFDLQDAQWQDGTPFTASDVAFTLQSVTEQYSPYFASAKKDIQSITVKDPHTIVIALKAPYAPLLSSLTCENGAGILPQHVFGGKDILTNPALQKPVGTGPFKLVEWKPGDYIRFARNDHYWDKGKPYLDGLIAKIIPSAASRTESMLAGQVDYTMYYYVPTNDYARLKQSGKFTFLPAHGPSLDYLFLNTSRKPFDNKQVRQALMYATNRAYLLKAAYHNVGSVATMPYSNRVPLAADKSIDLNAMYPYDPAKANQLLDAAGLHRGADGMRLHTTLTYMTDIQDYDLVALSIQNMWRQVGIDVQLKPRDRVALLPEVFTKNNFDMTLLTNTAPLEPAPSLSMLNSSSTIGQIFGNTSRYANDQIDQLLQQGETGTSDADRTKAYQAVQHILADELPYLTLHERALQSAVSNHLHGLDEEDYLPSFRDAWLDN